jgi:hypothetical protein
MEQQVQELPVRANGLSTLLNVIVAPREAFETLRVAPTWGWAFIVTVVLTLIGYVLLLPASHHAGATFLQHLQATNPTFAGMSDEAKAKMIHDAANPGTARDIFNAAFSVLALLIGVLLNAVILLLGNAVGGGEATFKKLWSGSMNIAAPTFGLSQLVVGIIATLRGPDSFGSIMDLYRVAPGLGWFSYGLHGFAASFLSVISVFAIWGLILNALMMRTMARVGPGIAWGFAALITLLGALVAGAFGALFGG